MSRPIQLSFVKILSFLSLIERSVPHIDNFSLYVPSLDFNPYDVISIQNEAKRMMEFIGLKGYTTTVTPCLTDNGTAGNINLNNSNEVFIEIDNKMRANRRRFKEAVLCVMAHEICHKYLYSHGLYLEETNSNEYCTDLATFFVGFGLLTVNGCYEQYETTNKNTNGSITTTTHTFSTGYLSPQNYLTTHIVVCKIHNIDYLDGVSANMLTYISQMEKRAILSTQLNREAIIEKFKSESSSIANKKREIIILKEYLELKEKELLSEYEKNDSLFNKLVLYGNAVEKLPFAAMHVLNLYQDFTYHSDFENLLENIEPKYHTELSDSLLTLKCPFCGTTSSSKITENGLSIRKCQCGKIFYWDSRMIEYHPEQNTHREPNNSSDVSDNSKGNLNINKDVSGNKFTKWIRSVFVKKK